MMMTDAFVVPEYVKWRRFDDEIVILDMKRGDYLGLNEVAAAVFECLAKGLTGEQAVTKLESLYEVDMDQLREDTCALVADLKSRGLLVNRGHSVGGAPGGKR